MFMVQPTPSLMTIRRVLAALLLIAALSGAPTGAQDVPAAQVPPPQPPSPAQAPVGAAAQAAPQGVAPARPPSAVDQLLGPIALYPDPLVALILPASTAPADIFAASAYLVQYGDATRFDSQPWDPSVRALAHYPAIVSWMAENIEWTRALGSAFLSSPGEVMDSIQRLRARAMASGALASTPQQLVVVAEGGQIEIIPAQSDAIYAPSYDTGVVYSEEPYYGYGGPFINFGEALPVGYWLSYCFDWGGHSLWVGGWSAWHGPGGWHRPHFVGANAHPGFEPWHPAGHGPGSPAAPRGRRVDSVPLPVPLGGAPDPPPSHFKRPGAQVGMQQGALASAVPLPSTPAPPLDRPRLQFDTGPNAPGQGEPERRYVPAQGTPRAQYIPPATEGASAPARSEATETAARSEPAPESAPPPARESAPAQSHGSSPPASHESAPAAAPATAPAGDPKNH